MGGYLVYFLLTFFGGYAIVYLQIIKKVICIE